MQTVERTCVEDEPEECLRSLLERPPGPLLQGPPSSVVVGELLCFNERDEPLVELSIRPGAVVVARTTVRLPRRRCGGLVIALEQGDPKRPIVIGVLQAHGPQAQHEPGDGLAISADGKALEVVAQRELVLRCGHASITLTAAGKVLIEGRYVLSRSAGANKIKGAVVDIN